RNPLYKPFDETIGLPTSEQTLADYLKQTGYYSKAIGKWHLGAHEKFHPLNRGFQEFYGFLGGGHRYFPEEFDIEKASDAKNESQSYRTKLVSNNEIVNETEYLTEALTREGVSFIQKNKEKPFFLYLAYNAPHAPLQAPQKYLDRFNNIQNPKRKTYAAMVSAVDDGVGLILNKLDELAIAENTIVIFLSDNGGPKEDNGSYNGLLKGGKGSLWEGGVRVPFAMRWPAEIPANTKYDKPVISLDIFATIANNIQKAPQTKNNLDGVNLLPFIKGNNNNYPHEYLFWRQYDAKNFAVLHATNNMKTVMIKDSLLHIFNLKKDVGEKENLLVQESAATDKYKEEFKKWEMNMKSPIFFGLNQEELYKKTFQQKQNP
ncbi:MAG: sulfatase-like hydrolase/transferase, partial [Chitinophagaceae bacterium]